MQSSDQSDAQIIAPPLYSHDSHIKHVLSPSFLVANKPFKWSQTSVGENLLDAWAVMEPRRFAL